MNTLKLVKDRIDHERKGRKLHYKDTQVNIDIMHTRSSIASNSSKQKKKDLDRAFACNRGF